MIPRVLIIDDEQEWRETFEDVFTTTGWDADSVADISNAKELLKTNSYKLIILDIFLSPTQVPLSYQRFLTFIARAYPNVIVAAVTGKPLAPDEAFALSRLGVSEVIYKPRVHLDDMRRLTHRILDPDDMGTTSIGQVEHLSLAVHRTIVAVDVEGFGNRHRTNRNQVAIRDGLYRAMREAFGQAGIPWADRDHEDRGDGMLILVSSEVPKSLFVESLPPALASALRAHNSAHPDLERIRLRMVLHAGEVTFDEHGATAASINLAFRLLESDPVKNALAESTGVLAVITSSWFFEEVVRHTAADAAAYQAVPVVVKETTTTGWICLAGLRGVAQCIPETFASNHIAETSTDIYNPVANIAASMHYVMAATAFPRTGPTWPPGFSRPTPAAAPTGTKDL
jgi:CheY-like chemotaxis protein